jgi:hypothetical protein
MSDTALTCQLEVISRPGPCGKPAKALWIQKDQSKVPVCQLCSLSVTVNGGELEAIPHQNQPTS